MNDFETIKERELRWALESGRCDCIHRASCDEDIELCIPKKCLDYKKEVEKNWYVIILDVKEKQKEK